MIITVAFDVKNHVEVMEGWPIKTGDMTFSLEREDNILKRVCLTFSGVGVEHAPSLALDGDIKGKAHLKTKGDIYADLARSIIMNWQAAVSGLQIVSLDYDSYEMRFHAENIEEEPHIHLKSLKSSYDDSLNSACDFEHMGRAFCVGPIPDERIESTAHFRDGRIAFQSGRYVDAYNNMFLFLETRYCDGKTGSNQQVDLLLKERDLCKAIEENAVTFARRPERLDGRKLDLFKPADDVRQKIKALVLLRGKLRHHSLKSPHRWDPNNQDEYESAARFLSAVVGDIVVKETIQDIYSPEALSKFREISVSTGFETKIKLTTYRMEKERTLELDMSYPTTVVSSQLCLNTVRHAIEACNKSNQLADTVRFEAAHGRSGLELFSLDFGVWAYTQARAIETESPIDSIRCSFEHFRAGLITKSEFTIPIQGQKLTISDVWSWLSRSFDHIEMKDPTTRIMSLKLFIKNDRRAIAAYRVGALVKN